MRTSLICSASGGSLVATSDLFEHRRRLIDAWVALSSRRGSRTGAGTSQLTRRVVGDLTALAILSRGRHRPNGTPDNRCLDTDATDLVFGLTAEYVRGGPPMSHARRPWSTSRVG